VGKHVRITLVIAALALVGCGRKPPKPEPLVMPAPAHGPPVVVLADFYERDGSLKSSGTRVHWLELPAGFTRSAARSSDTRDVYEAPALPFEKVCNFLSKRMFTGKVETTPNRARYALAMPLDMNEKAVRLNVSVIQADGTITLDVERQPSTDVKPLSEQEARALLNDERERAE
jgi:hypothetical protein